VLSKKISSFIIILFIAKISLLAQNIDSLQALLKSNKEDTNKVNLANNITKWYIDEGNYKVALQFSIQAKDLAVKLSYKKGEARAVHLRAIAYKNKGDYADAIQYNFEALKIREQLKDKKGIASSYLEIAQVYDYQGSSNKALDYYNRCLKIKEELNDKMGIASVYSDMGVIYDANGNYGKALRFYTQSLKIRESINDTAGLGDSYSNIGYVYLEQGDYNEAIKNYEKGFRFYQKIGYTKGIIAYYNSVGEIYRYKKNYALSQTMLKQAIDLSNQIGSKEDIKSGYLQLTYLDTIKGNYKFAFRDYQNYITYRDSLINEAGTKRFLEEQFKYENDKKEAAAKAEQDKKDAITAENERRQQVVLWLIAIAGAGVTIIALVIYRSLQQNKKAKKIIEEQKHKVEQHQKEIVDSITYAKRLQQAILPAIEAVKEYLPNSFIYYQPKDIVAGDFYWMHTSDECIYIAAADCTGHGVPGAMVSVVCSNALNRAVNEFNLSDTGAILDKTRELVIETFEKSDAEVKDGMDISLLRIKRSLNKDLNEETKEIQWSGANNNLWYVLNNELIEVKADKQPIGKYSEAKPFTTNGFRFNSPVTFYLFSDGYADQFSPADKKLMKKKFKDIVLSMQGKAMFEQKNYIEKHHVDWKGNAEQTDDVLVMGITV